MPKASALYVPDSSGGGARKGRIAPILPVLRRSTRLYDALGIPPDADDRVIKKAYKRQAL